MSANVPQLSTGICKRFHSGDKEDPELWSSSPVVQFLSIKKVQPTGGSSAQGTDRYRIIISDGVNFVQAMMATQLNHLVEDNIVGKNTIVRLEKMSFNIIQEKRLVIILGLQVLHKTWEKIGNPSPLGDSTTQTHNADETSSMPITASSVRAPKLNNPQQRDGRGVFPIEALSPYQNNWTIKARVIQKSDIRTYSNPRGEGKFFSVTLGDETGEIKATAFNNVLEELYDKLQEDKVYFISKARVNLAKKKFSTLNNDYELSFERNTEIEECLDTTDLPGIRYSFVELSGLGNLQKDAICDVIGVVKEIGDLTEITTKTNRTTSRRELVIVDQSLNSVRLTLWGKQAEAFQVSDTPLKPIIAFKGVKVGDFGGRSLSMPNSGTMAVNPDIPEAHRLRGWYDDTGSSMAFQPQSSTQSTNFTLSRDKMRTLGDVKDSEVGFSNGADPNFSCKATIMHIKADNVFYPSCRNNCNKKVVEGNNGWRCEKCDRSWDTPSYRYMLSMAVADHTGQIWLQGFNEVGVEVFGMQAEELHDIKERDEAQFNALMLRAQCNTFNFSCRARQDTYNDTTRVRYGIIKCFSLDYAAEARNYLNLLKSPWGQ